MTGDNDMSKTRKLSEREKAIVKATINLWNVQSKENFVPDYWLLNNEQLSSDEMRHIRMIVQDVSLEEKKSLTPELCRNFLTEVLEGNG
jgi:hypothetical protein